MNVIFFALPLQAKNIPNVYISVANNKEVPPDILYAIALTESGYNYQAIYNPWPWTLNVEGKAYRFSSRLKALDKLRHAIKHDQTVDAGLMQINWYWHKDKFRDIASILDPYNNLEKGADILLEQYALCGDWWEAVGRYHAPGKDYKSLKRAERYRQRVHKNWQRITKRENKHYLLKNKKSKEVI